MSRTRKPPQTYGSRGHARDVWACMATCPYFISIHPGSKAIKCQAPYAAVIEQSFELAELRNEWGHGYCTDIHGYKLCPLYIAFEKEEMLLTKKEAEKG